VPENTLNWSGNMKPNNQERARMEFTIFGVPVPKGRPRVACRGKFATMYTPKETRQAEEDFIRQSAEHKPKKPLEGSLGVMLWFYKKKPKSYPKKVTQWTTKPDIDNLTKLALDAMNGLFYHDDAQIIELYVVKKYDEIPRTEVNIRKL